MDVYMRKDGRITLPIGLREKYGLEEDTLLDVIPKEDRIVLIPINRYTHPTEALYGSVSMKVDKPKEIARKHMRRKLKNEVC